MKKIKVINRTNISAGLPLYSTVVWLLGLDHWNAPEWLYGIVGLLIVIDWGTSIYKMVTQEKVDIFEDKEVKNLNADESLRKSYLNAKDLITCENRAPKNTHR